MDEDEKRFLADLHIFVQFLELANKFKLEYESLFLVRIVCALGLRRLVADPIGVRYSVKRAHFEMRKRLGKVVEM